MTLDPRKGERALVIKNTHGDWAFLIGRWDGFRRGVSAVPGTRETLVNCPLYVDILCLYHYSGRLY